MEKSHDYHKIGVDVDGVLTDFTTGFGRLLCHIAKKEFPDNFSPKRFMWFDDLGITGTHVAEAWDRVAGMPSFWASLAPLPTAELDLQNLNKLIERNHDVYFITKRPFRGAKYATEHWLRSHGIYYPTVLISDDKGSCAKGLKLTHFIDDLTDNCYSVLRARGVKTKCYLMEASYNADFHDIYVPKTHSITAMLKKEKLLE